MTDQITRRVIIRDATETDLPFMNEIYNWNVVNSVGLFFTAPVTDEYRLKWFRSLKNGNVKGEPYPCLLGLVRQPDGQEIKFGYICYLPWVPGEEFERVVEISLYIAQEHTGRGLGVDLLTAILDHPSTGQLRGIIAGITTENTPSCKFFAKRGFVYSGQLDNAGYKFERWLDVAYYTRYLFKPPTKEDSPLKVESRLINTSLQYIPSRIFTYRDVEMTDLLNINDIHNKRNHYITLNSFTGTTDQQERRLWYESLSRKPNLLYPAILVETASELLGYAYLWPMSADGRPAYDFSVELHLASITQTVTNELINAILSHPLTKSFRLISTAVAGSDLPIQEDLLSRGFRKSVTWHQLMQRGDNADDILLYSIDLKDSRG